MQVSLLFNFRKFQWLNNFFENFLEMTPQGIFENFNSKKQGCRDQVNYYLILGENVHLRTRLRDPSVLRQLGLRSLNRA